ncbi:hypothetical protein DPMN_034848 [Dreissena polymorpha]|uniref:Uncharacterized protein n=1 Tax=Dreissena polymorpha TaxID=45954 RepID=A0A9D4M8L2_DREPO|nr:hypothetical protein DPMN_034848 [Dreissena polymorpha]
MHRRIRYTTSPVMSARRSSAGISQNRKLTMPPEVADADDAPLALLGFDGDGGGGSQMKMVTGDSS